MTVNSSRFGINSKAQRVEIVQTDYNTLGGAYRLAMCSGVMTSVAAVTSSAGHVGAFRNSSTTLGVLVNRIRAKLWTTANPSVLQQLGLSLTMARAYTASHSGGTAATITTNNGKKRTSHATLAGIDLRISDTTALTAGTHTLDAQPFSSQGGYIMVAATTAPGTTLECSYLPEPGMGPIVLAQDEGFIVGNLVAQANSLAFRVSLEVDFHVVDLTKCFVQ
jgi:hypothetical protein